MGYYTQYSGEIKVYPQNYLEMYAAHGIVSSEFCDTEISVTSVPIGSYVFINVDPKKGGIRVRASEMNTFLKRLVSLFEGKSRGYLSWQGEDEDDFGYWSWGFDQKLGLQQYKGIKHENA